MRINKSNIRHSYSLALFCGVISLSCIEDPKNSIPYLTGQWKDTTTYIYTIKDSLFQNELMKYEDSIGSKVIPLGPKWDSLAIEIGKRVKCDSTDCATIIWMDRSYIIFESDLEKRIITRNLKNNWAFTSKFRNDQDSLYECCNSKGKYVGLRFSMNKGMDTLTLFYVEPRIYSRNEDALKY